MLAQESGLLAIPAFGEAIGRIQSLLSESGRGPLVPFSVAGYLGYGALMGAVLSVGAVGSLLRWRYGLHFIGAFLALYALLFVNFQMVNVKLLHLAVCAALFGVLVWLRDDRGQLPNNSSKPTPLRGAA
jgi:hypothetical protein